MVIPVRFALFSLLVACPLLAAVPVGETRYAAAGQASQAPIAVTSGDRALGIWNRGDGAVRFDAASQPLDVPAIGLPQPRYTAGADLAATEHGWTVGWTIFELGELASSSVQLVDVDRDGTVSNLRVHALPEVVDQGTSMQLAVRGDVTVVAYPSGQEVVVAAIDARGRVTRTTFEGGLGELTATPSGFALVAGGGVMLLPESGAGSAGKIALPERFGAAEIEPDGEDLLLAGSVDGNVAVVRIRGGEATILSTLPGPASFLRFARYGRNLLLVWKRPLNAYFSSRSFDLMAARVPLEGPATEPVVLRPNIDSESRFVCCADPPDVVAIGDGWTLLWSEGYRSPSITWRDIFSARTGPTGPVSIDTPRLMTYRAAPQQLVGMAYHGGVVLVVWQEPAYGPGPSIAYAARMTADGRRIDAVDLVLGEVQPHAVRETPNGFAVFTSSVIFTIDANGAVRSDPFPAPMHDLSCTATGCLAAWREGGNASSWAIRVSRWRDGVLLDAPGILVHAGDREYHELAVANDGERFLVAFARRGVPAGSILAVSTVDWRDGELRMKTSDAAASTTTIDNLHLLFDGDGYLATWMANGYRASRLTRQGDVTDGEETSWEGWPLATTAPVRRMVFDGERTLLLTTDSLRYTLFELRGRVPVPIAGGAARMASIDCAAPRACAITLQEDVRGRPWYASERLFLYGSPAKRRASAIR